MNGNGPEVKKKFCVLPKKIGGKWVWLRWYNEISIYYKIVLDGKTTTYKQVCDELIKK